MARMSKLILILALVVALPSVAPSQDAQAGSHDEGAAKSLVIYSGRSKSLVDPLVRKFQKDTGIEVKVRYGKTAPLAALLREEGAQTQADLFWAQDAGALGAMARADRFQTLPQAVLDRVPASLRNKNGHWVATSGRARVLAHSTERCKADALPQSVFDLTDPKYKGKVGWAPTNGSFQAFVTAMRVLHGDDKTKAWLVGMKANAAKVYPKNTPLVRALADGGIDMGVTNHYYVVRFRNADKKFPAQFAQFKAGDVGNLVNVAGVGMLKTAKNKSAAERFVAFLLSTAAQQYITSAIYEYPVTGDVIANPKLIPFEDLMGRAPKIELGKLEDLTGTLELLRSVGLL